MKWLNKRFASLGDSDLAWFHRRLAESIAAYLDYGGRVRMLLIRKYQIFTNDIACLCDRPGIFYVHDNL